MNSPRLLAAAALALTLFAAPAGADAAPGRDAACDPGVRRALAESARAGVERDVAIVRHPEQGIRDPDSILDFSCIEDLFDYRSFDILFDPGRGMDDLLGLLQRRVCAVAREAYRRYVGRHLDAAAYTARATRLPGLGAAPMRRAEPNRAGNTKSDTAGEAARFRNIVGGRR